jgi:hypothetical protein
MSGFVRNYLKNFIILKINLRGKLVGDYLSANK